MTHLTDEQLKDLERSLSTALLYGMNPIYQDTHHALRAIRCLRAERAAHQATRAELERYRKRADELQRAYRNALDAARQLADAVREHVSVPDYHRSVEMVDALAAYDAARARQGEGAE